MAPWPELQDAFAAALLDPQKSVPPSIVDPRGQPCTRRFGVYRNNVHVGLVGALSESFPAVRQLVGEAFFLAMTVEYVRIDPPRSPIMATYGAGFPEFIARFEPAAVLPYLADVARIEQAWVEVYHAADAEPVDPAKLAALPADVLPHLRFAMHPSLRVIRSEHSALSIWRFNTEPDGTAAPQADLAEDTLVLRPGVEVVVRAIPPGAAQFLQALTAGATVLDAWRDALDETPEFDLAANLAAIMDVGATVGFALPAAADEELPCEAEL